MTGISHFEFKVKSMKTETKTLSEFPKGVKATIEQILGSEERTIFKRAEL